jgi:hypothetical protein
MDDTTHKARFIARAAKTNLLKAYKRQRNVIGAGFGKRYVNGERTDEHAIVVYVMHKTPRQFLPLSLLLPERIYVGGDHIAVDVVQTGPIYPLEFTARERPAPSGISIGHTAITAGTLGALVTDLSDGSLCILSNNHVLANENAAMLGDTIVQPGPYDGGTSPADDIATLKRFVTIAATGNTVDCAIAQVLAPPNLNAVNLMKDQLMPVPGPNHPAVGLLFAGSCNRTFFNPIDNVLKQLNIEFVDGPGATAPADVGMNIEKVGRTTEYTSSTISEIDVDVTVDYAFGSADFVDQIATMWMSDGGDSGSVACKGGSGGSEDHCSGGVCESSRAASKALGRDLDVDRAVEKEFRENYLTHTRTGRYLVDLYFRNEHRILDRTKALRQNESDTAFGGYLYDKYASDVRKVLLEPRQSTLKVTDEHLKDIRSGIGRLTQHMKGEEREAAERALKIIDRAHGKDAREILAMLDDSSLLNEVHGIFSSVGWLEQPGIRNPADKTYGR